MKLSERSLSLKLNGKVGWKDEIWKAIQLLDIPVEKIHLYFLKKSSCYMNLREGHNGTNHVNRRRVYRTMHQ